MLGTQGQLCTKMSTPLGVFQMNCLRCICGISLHENMPNVDILHDIKVQHLVCGVPAAKQKIQVARSYFQHA